ncbi:GNAT family N-acetyltransferase [Candidatus Falkowbacteria bacterium]|nr:GNAT family N-acetyltransferase [Candidatus Falkowbacteria bacterium]
MADVFLKPTTLSDIDNIMTWVNDPEIAEYFASLGNITREQETEYLEKMLASANDRLFSIFVDGVYAGQCSLNQIHWPSRNARLFLVLKKKFHGRGLAREVIAAVLRIAFDELALNKVWLIVREKNEKGRHVYRKAGFETEGVLREEYRVKGKFVNMVRMAILEREYRQWYHQKPKEVRK